MSCYLMNERRDRGHCGSKLQSAGIYNSKGRFYNAATKELIEYESAEEAAIALAVQNIASCQARYPSHGEIAGGFLESAEEEKAYLAGCARLQEKRLT
jgi:hypothetical protein